MPTLSDRQPGGSRDYEHAAGLDFARDVDRFAGAVVEVDGACQPAREPELNYGPAETPAPVVGSDSHAVHQNFPNPQQGLGGYSDLLDDLEAPLDEDRCEAHRRLVHEHQLRARHERPAHRDHLLLAARERARELRAALVEEREERIHVLEVLGRPAAVQVRAHLQILEHRHRAEEPPVLGHDRHPLADAVARWRGR